MVHAINVYSVYPIDEKRTFDDTIDIDDDIGRKKNEIHRAKNST